MVVPGAMPRPLTGVPAARVPTLGGTANVSVLEPAVVVALTAMEMLPVAVAAFDNVYVLPEPK